MSEGGQTKVKRAVASVQALTEPVTPVLPEPKPMLALPAPQQAAAEKVLDAYKSALASIGETQTAIASDIMTIALEMTGLARSNLAATGDSLAALLAARNLVDVVEIQIGFARRSLGAIVDGSTRLGELGLRLASSATKPVLGGFAG
jgi:hypothetical protein